MNVGWANCYLGIFRDISKKNRTKFQLLTRYYLQLSLVENVQEIPIDCMGRVLTMNLVLSIHIVGLSKCKMVHLGPYKQDRNTIKQNLLITLIRSTCKPSMHGLIFE